MTLPVFHFLFCFSPLFWGRYTLEFCILFVCILLSVDVFILLFLDYQKNCIKWKNAMHFKLCRFHSWQLQQARTYELASGIQCAEVQANAKKLLYITPRKSPALWHCWNNAVLDIVIFGLGFWVWIGSILIWFPLKSSIRRCAFPCINEKQFMRSVSHFSNLLLSIYLFCIYIFLKYCSNC